MPPNEQERALIADLTEEIAAVLQKLIMFGHKRLRPGGTGVVLILFCNETATVACGSNADEESTRHVMESWLAGYDPKPPPNAA